MSETPDAVGPTAEAVGRLLGEVVTTRNWTTVAKIHAALLLDSA